MCDLICITNRSLCRRDFLLQIEQVAKAHPKAVILREKDLKPEEYMVLAKQVMEICQRYDTVCILHSFVKEAKSLGCDSIHLPLQMFRELSKEEKAYFRVIGVSCHSILEANEAQKLGATYITAGHIFNTDCKKGVPGKGLDFLQAIVGAVEIPVYAIGGIDKHTYGLVKKTKAAGSCIMSGFMTCRDANEFIKEIEGYDRKENITF